MNEIMIFTAPVVIGSGRGKDLRVPTINVDITSVPMDFGEGIYACFVQIGNQIYKSAMHYGPRPVFNDVPSCEVHLLDADLSTAPAEIRIEVVQHLRDVQNFDSAEKLQQQMMKDIDEARAILGTSDSAL